MASDRWPDSKGMQILAGRGKGWFLSDRGNCSCFRGAGKPTGTKCFLEGSRRLCMCRLPGPACTLCTLPQSHQTCESNRFHHSLCQVHMKLNTDTNVHTHIHAQATSICVPDVREAKDPIDGRPNRPRRRGLHRGSAKRPLPQTIDNSAINVSLSHPD